MATYIVGIDPAARKLAMWSQDPAGGPHRSQFMALDNDDAVAAHQAFRALCVELGTLSEIAIQAKDYHPKFVVYQESPLVQGRGQRIAATLAQALVGGAYMAAAGEFRAEHRRVHVGTWKSSIVGHGSADKGKIQEFVAENWPDDWKRCFDKKERVIEDLADARCILEYGIQNNRMFEAMRKKRKVA